MNYARAISTKPQPVKLTIEDLILLEESGALDQYHKTELINGVIVAVNSQLSPHMMVKNGLYRRLADACDRIGLHAWSEGTIGMPPHNAPEPDLLVTNERPTVGYVREETVVLIGEVADSTLSSDLKIKAKIYAARAIPEYWVIDVKGRRVHRLWSPGPTGYAERDLVAFGEPLQSVTIPGLQVATDNLL